MIVATTETVIGHDIREVLGAVRGNTICVRNVGRDITQGPQNIVDGELKSYTGLVAEARDEATDRMVAEAGTMGVDAVVSIRYVIAEVTQGAAEIPAYGTVVTLVDGIDPDADTEPTSESNADVA